jgi:Tfp pilus assembly protein PilF
MAIQYISRARGLLKASFRPVTAPAARIALAPMPTAHSLDLAGKADPPPELTASDIDALPKVAARADAGTESPPAARGPTMDFSHVRVGAIPPSERPSPVDYRAIIEAAIAVLPNNNVEARRTVYEHALHVVHARLDSIRPPLSSFARVREELSLERAIKKIEAFHLQPRSPVIPVEAHAESPSQPEPEPEPELGREFEVEPEPYASARPLPPQAERAPLPAPVPLSTPAPLVARRKRRHRAAPVHGIALRMFGIVGVVLIGLVAYWAIVGRPDLRVARSLTRLVVKIAPTPTAAPAPQPAGSGTAAPVDNATRTPEETRVSMNEPASASSGGTEAIAPLSPEDSANWLSACRQAPTPHAFTLCAESEMGGPDFATDGKSRPPFWIAMLERANEAKARGRGGVQPGATTASTAILPPPPRTTNVAARNTYLNGLARLKADDLERAIADFSEAIQLDQQFADAYVQRGQAYFKNGNPDRALADFSQAITIDVRQAAAYKARGMTLLYKGDEAAAIVDLSRAIQFAEADRKRLTAVELFYAHRSRAALYERRQLYDSEILDLSAMIDAYWKHPDLAAELKANYREQGAATLISGIYRQRASIYLKRANIDAAVGDLSVAMEVDPQRVLPLLLERARIQEATGRGDKATIDFQRALELNPNSDDAKAGLARLKARG